MSEQIVVETLKKVEDQLTCPVCLSFYTDPKVLPCLHVFCQACLELLVKTDADSNKEVLCPSCRRPALLTEAGTADLVPAFHILHLFDIQDALRKAGTTEKSQCEKCHQHVATAFCRNCGQYVCETCAKTHGLWSELASHEVVSIHKIQDDAAKMVPLKKKAIICSKHHKDLELYCETCFELICHNCTIQQHREHNYDLVSDVFSTHKIAIDALLVPLKGMLATVNGALIDLDNSVQSILHQQTAIDSAINKVIAQLHEELEQRKQEFLEQLHELSTEKIKSLGMQKDEVERIQTQLNSAVVFTEDRLRTGTEGEILAMKKHVVSKSQDLIREFNPRILVPCQRANMVFRPEQLQELSKSYRAVVIASVCPELCCVESEVQRTVVANEPFAVTVHVKDENSEDYLEAVEGMTAELVSSTTTLLCEVSRSVKRAHYTIRCCPTICKDHELFITINGKGIPGSPFPLKVKRSIKDIAKSPKVLSKLKKPCGVACNSRGEVIIVESSVPKVSVYTLRGLKPVRKFGTRGSGLGQFNDPDGVTVDSYDNILVVDSGNHRIQRFTSGGEFIDLVGTKGEDPLQFNHPTSVRIHPHTGNFYVTDQENHRIQVLKSDFSFVSSFGYKGIKDGDFNGPSDVTFDADGNVYVCDSWNNRVQVFTLDGQYVRKFGEKGYHEGEAVHVTIDATGDTVLDTSSEFKSTLSIPTNLFIDSDSYVFVSEGGHCISIFTIDGTFITSFGKNGGGLVEFNYPRGLASSTDGLICVCDYGNGRLQVF